MKLAHLALDTLIVTHSNMRHEKKKPDISDILPSIRDRGILQPVLVRANGDQYEVVAGRRRYFAACAIAKETGEPYEIPCAIMEAGDDAAALEASLIENIARVDASEMEAYSTFSKLFKEGRSVAEIARTFGISGKQVEQRLALGNLLPAIRDLYTQEEINVGAVRTLTLASVAKQKEWLALYRRDNAPVYERDIRKWLFDGSTVSVSAALFDEADYTGEIVTDLFGEDRYFADTAQFWDLQNAAIAAKAEGFKAKGWADVEIVEPGRVWHQFQYVKVAKKKGGKVYLDVSQDGKVSIAEGYLSHDEVQKAQKRLEAKAAGKEMDVSEPTSSRPEVTQAQNMYIEAHRQAAVQAALVENPGKAFRLLMAHLIAGSEGIKAHAQGLHPVGQKIAESVKAQTPYTVFSRHRDEAMTTIGSSGHETITRQRGSIIPLFKTLLGFDDSEVMKIAAVIMAECLDAGSKAGEAAGRELGVELADTWRADDVFFEQLRDREVIGAMLAEVAGQAVADAHITATGKIKKGIIKDCLTGANGREKTNWLPRWLRPEIGTYTERGGIDLAKPDVVFSDSYYDDENDVDEAEDDDLDDDMDEEHGEMAA